MGFYKNIFKKKIVIAGRSKGAKPSYLMPPDGTNVKQGHQIYEAIDLICEGEVQGFVNQEGVTLKGTRAKKNFNKENNVIGDSTLPIDQGIYFDDVALRDSSSSVSAPGGNSVHSTYNIEFRSGRILQGKCNIVNSPSKLHKISVPIKGPYDMTAEIETQSDGRGGFKQVVVNNNGARKGTGSRDIRFEGTSARDFVNWQNYVPREAKAKPYTYTNYDKDVGKIDIGLQIDGLSDTKSFSTKSENNAGKSKMGTPLPLTITFLVKVGKVDRSGTKQSSNAQFTVRPGKGKTVGDGNGKLKVRGIITSPYTITLEDISLPTLSDTDLYNFIEVNKVQHETISNLIRRDAGVGTITEKYLDTYYYPGSCYVASQIDSQYYPQLPARTFRLKGKKIKIPSNYHPINPNGTDRRFSEGSTARNSITSFRVTNIIDSSIANYDADDSVGNFTVFIQNVNGSKSWKDTSNNHTITKMVSTSDSSKYAWLYQDNDGVPQLTSSHIPGATATSEDYPWEVEGFNGHWTRFDGSAGVKGFNKLIFSNFSPGFPSTKGMTIYDGDWDGTFKYGWSDNPAWIYYDLLTNRRYGLGSYLRDVDIIDKWTLFEIGMYADAVTLNDGSKTTNDMGGAGKFIGLEDGFGGLEPRFSCNILIKDQTSAYDAIQNLARSFRAMTYFNNSCVSVKVDRPYFFEDFNNTTNAAPKENKFPPHLIFNNLNVKDGMFSYADVDRQTKLSAVEVSFLDKRNNFTSQTEYVEDPEAIKTVGLNFKQIEGIGATSKAQAHRMAKYILFESQNTTETISFNAGFEALLIQPGDIIRVEDEMRNFNRNYGTVLGASGVTTYYDPDGTTNISTLNEGKGPSAIIVEPAIGSDLTDYVTGGNIHIYNPVGKSGIEDFYRNPSSNNELYREIHSPQVMSLKIKPGGLNSSYEIIDSGVAIFINGLETFANGSAPSQWFSEKDVNIKHGSIYNIDTSGINPKYYRVLNIEEDNNQGFNVSATIHHTGKFKFVEENISFDIDADTFQPNLTLSTLNRPDKPSSVTNQGFSAGANRSLNLNLRIHDPTDGDKVGDKYVVIIEEPDSTTIVSEHFKSNSSFTDITLSGDSKIDQIGEYTVLVFSETTTPLIARSIDSTKVEFTTSIADFAFGATEPFTEYSNIFINTDFTSEFNNADETGVAQNSFFENDPSINAIINLEFEDIFLNQGSEVLGTVNAQTINLLDHQGNLLVQNFKTLTSENLFTVTNEELNTAFQYEGDGRYQVPPNINFEVDSFQIPLQTISKTIDFNATFSETPAIFTQQKQSGSFNTTLRPIARNGNSQTQFQVGSENNQYETNYTYIASQTGNFIVNSKNIEINFVTKNNTTAYQEVQFNNAFSSPPIVIIELQSRSHASQERVSETCITGVTKDGFHFKAFQQDNNPAGGAGQYAYIAIEETSFNNTTSSEFPSGALNFAAIGVENYSFGDPILNQFNGSESSVTNSRFNHDQYVVLCQRSGEDADLEDKCFVVHETGAQNRLHQQMLTSGLEDGIRSSQTDGSNNHILLTGGLLNGPALFQKGVGSGDFTLFAWAKFEPGLNGKQYLLESHRNGTGIAWFQSGDGKNYVNLNGVDYLAITGNGGASLNDGNLHSLTVEVNRDTDLNGRLDGAQVEGSFVRNTRILEQSTGFDLTGPGQAMPQNPHVFDGTYRRVGNSKSYVHTTSFFSVEVNPTGSESTWILIDNDSSTSYAHTPIAWSGSEVVSSEVASFRVTNTDGGDDPGDGVGNFTANGTLRGSTKWLDNSNQHFIEKRVRQGFPGEYVWVYGDNDSDPFFVSEVIPNATASSKEYPWNVDSRWAHFTLGGGTFEGFDELTFSNFKDSQNNLTSHSHPANVQNWTGAKFYTGFTVSNVGTGMKDNSHGSFDGEYTGSVDLYVNTTTSGLRIKKTGSNNTWILCDDDPAHTYDHDRIAWSGGENIQFPWNVSTWSGGSTITDGTITDSSAPGFSLILSGKYVGTNAPSITNLRLETFDAQTGFKVLGNSELPGNAFTSGHIKKYIALQSGTLSANQLFYHHNLPDSFRGGGVGIKFAVNTRFLLDVNSQEFFKDRTPVASNTASGSIVGSVERSEAIINRNKSSNFHFLQIGVTGTL